MKMMSEMERRSALMKEISEWNPNDLMKEIYIQLNFMAERIQHIDIEKSKLEKRSEAEIKALEVKTHADLEARAKIIDSEISILKSRTAALEGWKSESRGEKKQGEVFVNRHIPIFVAIVFVIQLILSIMAFVKST